MTANPIDAWKFSILKILNSIAKMQLVNINVICYPQDALLQQSYIYNALL